MENVYVQLISTVGAIALAVLGFFFNGKYRELRKSLDEEKKRNEELEAKFKSTQLEVINNRIRIFKEIRDVRKLYELEKAAELLFARTKASRFLVIVAFNGNKDFNFVTVIYQKGAHGVVLDAVEAYNHLEIDRAYNKMLKDVERVGFALLNRDKMDESLLRDIYHVEDVRHSLIRFISRENIDEGNDIMAFTSTATHDEEEFHLDELTQIHYIHTSFINKIIQSMILTPGRGNVLEEKDL